MGQRAIRLPYGVFTLADLNDDLPVDVGDDCDAFFTSDDLGGVLLCHMASSYSQGILQELNRDPDSANGYIGPREGAQPDYGPDQDRNDCPDILGKGLRKILWILIKVEWTHGGLLR